MNRAELVALREAIDTILGWPDAVRDQVARWLNAEKDKPNGLDRARPQKPNGAGHDRRQSIDARIAERKLLAVMTENPAGCAELARLVKAKGTSTLERLKRLQGQGRVEKTSEGWRLRADPTSPPSP
jgi:predicted Rossmann fold nucleotide-binding protein DprA/Smf involved in DNA uptake